MAANRWPAGLSKAIIQSRSKTAFRFVILDNSKSMCKRDGHVIVYDRKGVPRVEESTRWDEVVASTRVIANLADLASLPTEIRLLNRSEPVVIGASSSSSSSSSGLVRVLNNLNHEPSGTTPMCKQLLDVIEQLQCMEYELKASGKVAQLIIMTDCETTDGNLVDVLKPLEGMPLQIIIRMCTDERSVTEYWHNINAQLDLDIYVLDHCDVEAVEVMENNNWLTYAEPLHRMREFGIMVPALNHLNYRQLTRTEIKSVLELLGGTDSLLLPNPETDWPAFVEAAKVSLQSLPMVYCPVRNEPRPWIDVEQVYYTLTCVFQLLSR